VPTRPRALFNATSATTRATQSLERFARQAQYLLVPKQVITSPESGLQYRIERLLGQGGFGQVFLASRHGRSDRVPDIVCIKVSSRIDGWLREAYFGELLDAHPRAIRVYDAFPLFGHGQVLYCLAMEYAAHGDLSAHLERSEKAFSEQSARREIAGILQVLDKLHSGQMLHRDLTPVNVFVCDNRRLKLGDFGIARQQSDQRGITARTLNAFTAPSDIINGAVPKWRARDDVYQVGQLLGMLVKGSAKSRLRAKDVRHLSCSDHLKEIIYRCIGERRKRYESAEELIAALNTPPVSLRSGVLRTLKGAHLAFTGVLTETRKVATRAAARAGAVVHGHPSATTTVVVRGRPNPLQAAGRDGGRKLLEIKRLREKGYRITILNEQQFWKLVGRKP
jgi:serine/threonine protein kinase